MIINCAIEYLMTQEDDCDVMLNEKDITDQDVLENLIFMKEIFVCKGMKSTYIK